MPRLNDRVADDAARIVDRLAAVAGASDAFNPYADFDSCADGANAPATRRANLHGYLIAMAERRPSDLWLGEAPSKHGARRTGIPFTGEGRLEWLSAHIGVTPGLQRATINGGARESQTAREIWGAVPASLPLLWNAVLFHTNRGEEPWRNRTPRRSEIVAHREILRAVIELFEPRRVLAIGRVAEDAAQGLGIEITYVRHPAQGGTASFRNGARFFAMNAETDGAGIAAGDERAL